MSSKLKAESSKNKLSKIKEKPKPKEDKKIKESNGKIVKKKKKTNKKEEEKQEQQRENQEVKEEEPFTSKEIQALDKHINYTQSILEQEKDISTKLDNILNYNNIKGYLSDDYLKINRNVISQSKAVLETYDNSLSYVSGVLQNTIEKLQDSKYYKEENKNLNYRLDMLTLDDDRMNNNEKRFNTLAKTITNEAINVREMITSLEFKAPFSYVPNKDKVMDDCDLRGFFQGIKYFIKNINDSIREKEREMNFLKYDNKCISDEIMSYKYRTNEENIKSNPKSNTSVMSGDFPFSLKSNTIGSIEYNSDEDNRSRDYKMRRMENQ